MKAALASFVAISSAWIGLAWYVASGTSQPRPMLCTPKVGQEVALRQFPNLRTVKVKRGNMLTTINATGTLRPEESVEVGAQLTGAILAFGKDSNGKPVDFGSHVKKGDLLAKIDPTIYQAQVDSAKASLESARASLVQLNARLTQAYDEWKRAARLLPDKAIADSDYELITTNHEVAVASVEVGKAAVAQCQAALKLAETNLEYTDIKSPIDGVIIDRRVDIGQTVIVSFFNTPGLFLIAKDLKRMRVWASVKEVDISRIRAEMPVRFTVDARPGEEFCGKVAHVRLNATRAPDGAMFTVVVDIDDPKDLLPYLTANVAFDERHPNVLLVPNVALQESPQSPQADADETETASGNPSDQKDGPNTPAAPKPLSALAAKAQTGWRRIWVRIGDSIRSIDVQIGTSDEAMTEVLGGNLKEGMEVVLGDSPASDGA